LEIYLRQYEGSNDEQAAYLMPLALALALAAIVGRISNLVLEYFPTASPGSALLQAGSVSRKYYPVITNASSWHMRLPPDLVSICCVPDCFSNFLIAIKVLDTYRS